MTSTETIGDALRKALAPNRRDGPGFFRAMERFNAAVEDLQADGTLPRWVASRPPMLAREWSDVVETVHEMAYSRVVGPHSNELEVSGRRGGEVGVDAMGRQHHPKYPDEIARTIREKEDSYGELRHMFEDFLPWRAVRVDSWGPQLYEQGH